MEKKTVFRLFACCIPTWGINRSTISDVQRNKIFFIPNALFQILDTQSMLSIDEIKKSYQNEFDSEIDDYFSYLIHNELGFYCDNPENFPQIDLNWERPEIITNALLDIDNESTYDIKNFIRAVQFLKCKNIEIRICGGYNFQKLEQLCNVFKDSIFRYVSILVKNHETLNGSNIKQLCSKQSRIHSLIVFDSPIESHDGAVKFVKENITLNCCGVINTKYFSPNLELFSESQLHNTCLNRKVSIDSKGFIRNCPSMKEHFGHIDETNISDIVKLQEFQKYWSIDKSQIDTCKVCEFRHVCTDCRAFTDNPESRYSKPSKCSYNPYTNTW